MILGVIRRQNNIYKSWANIYLHFDTIIQIFINQTE